jgi:hypothetical protein
MARMTDPTAVAQEPGASELSPSPSRVAWWKRNPRKKILLLLAFLFALLIGDGVWTGLSTAKALNSVRSELEKGADAFQAGRVSEAAAHFSAAEDAAARANQFRGHPAAMLGSVLPFIGDDVRAVRSLADASDVIASAGLDVVEAGRATGWNGEGLPGVEQGGSINLDLIDELAPDIEAAARKVETARDILTPVDPDGLFGPLRTAVETAKDRITDQGGAIIAASRLVKLLPGFLGANGDRLYFVAFQNLSDPRGTGGYIGTFGALGASHGRMGLIGVWQTADVGRVHPVQAPADYRARYARFGGTSYPNSVNYSPDFPTDAEVLLRMWRQVDPDARIDGVIFVDPIWASYMLSAIGPVSSPSWPEELNADNVARILLHDAIDVPASEFASSNQIQADLAVAIWQGLLDRPLPGRPFADAMARATEEGHMLVYSAHPSEQRLLDELGATGRADLGENPFFVTWFGATQARTGYFLQTRLTSDISLHLDGSASVETSVLARNATPPDAPPTILTQGLDPSAQPGLFAGYANVYLPADARRIQVDVEDSPTVIKTGRELGHRVATAYVQVPAGRDAVVSVRYEVPEAATEDDGDLLYRMRLVPQTTLNPPFVQVRLKLPAGSTLLDTGPGVEVSGDTVTFAVGSLTTPDDVWVRFTRD